MKFLKSPQLHIGSFGASFGLWETEASVQLKLLGKVHKIWGLRQRTTTSECFWVLDLRCPLGCFRHLQVLQSLKFQTWFLATEVASFQGAQQILLFPVLRFLLFAPLRTTNSVLFASSRTPLSEFSKDCWQCALRSFARCQESLFRHSSCRGTSRSSFCQLL